MLTALILSVLAMTIIVGVRYLAVSGMFAWLTDRRLPGLYADRGSQIRKEIGWSLASAFIYAAPAGILAWGWQTHGWTRIYSNVAEYPLWWLPASVLVYLLLHDTWFYWTHRLMPRPSVYKRMHAVHHASRNPTAWAAMSVTNHMGWELFPNWLVRGPAGRWLITASHHQRHHEKYLCNFGLYFRFWDRLCGTDRGLGEFSAVRSQPLPRS